MVGIYFNGLGFAGIVDDRRLSGLLSSHEAPIDIYVSTLYSCLFPHCSEHIYEFDNKKQGPCSEKVRKTRTRDLDLSS